MMCKNFFVSIFILAISWVASASAATYEDGEAALMAGKHKEAVAIWEGLAENGDISSLLRLAKMYEIGSVVKLDKQTSFKLYSQAAERGSFDAQLKLGSFYMTGDGGVKQDREKAREIYRSAAYKGYAKAQYAYGVTYFRGEGVKTDYVKAHAWMSVAAKNGYEIAKVYGEQIQAILSKQDLEKSKKLTKSIMAELKK